MIKVRIMKEKVKKNKDSPENIKALSINEHDIFHWKATIKRLKYADYEDRKFFLDIQMLKVYP